MIYFQVFRCSLHIQRWHPFLPVNLWFCFCLFIRTYAYASWPFQVQFGQGGNNISPSKKVSWQPHHESLKHSFGFGFEVFLVFWFCYSVHQSASTASLLTFTFHIKSSAISKCTWYIFKVQASDSMCQNFILWLSNTQLYVYTTFCSCIHLLMHIWVVSTFWLLWTLMYKDLFESLLSTEGHSFALQNFHPEIMSSKVPTISN